jgi:hypothetical protein
MYILRKVIELDVDKQAISVYLIQLQQSTVHSLAIVEKIYEQCGIYP